MSTTQIINELDFTSAPINAVEVIRENSIVKQKWNYFQK